MHNRSMFKPRVPKPSDWRAKRAARRWAGRAFRVALMLLALAFTALLMFAPQVLFHLTLFWLVD